MINSDIAHQLTEKELADLERRIASEYKKAADELQKTIDDYFDKFKDRDAKKLKDLQDGKITKQEYQQWRIAQMAQGKRFEALRDRLAERYTKANEVAAAYINDTTPGIYSLNRNYAAYTIEQAGANVSFDLWDEQTVKRLIVEHPDLMPNWVPKREVDKKRDLAWGKRQITAQVTQGILMGDSIPNIAKRLQTNIPNMERVSAVRAARTAVTGAQNAGRLDSYFAAEEMGIKLKKKWIATLDNRTRHAHQLLDGQVADNDKPFKSELGDIMFPGDPSAEPANLWNCRCTLIADIEGVDMSDAKRRVRNPETGEDEVIENMTFSEWKTWKKNGSKKTSDKIQEFIPAKTIEEAGEYATRFANKVDFSNLSINQANAVNKQLNYLFEKYNAEKIENINSSEKKAIAKAGKKILSLNPKKLTNALASQKNWYNTREETKKTIDDLQKRLSAKVAPGLKLRIEKQIKRLENNLKFSRWTVFSNVTSKELTIKDTVTHEFGHIISDQKAGMISGLSASEKGAEEALKKRKIWESVFEKAKKEGDVFEVSEYGATDYNEFFSECFVMYENGEKLPKYIIKGLLEVLK